MFFTIFILLCFFDKSYANVVLSSFSRFERLVTVDNRVCDDDDRLFTHCHTSDIKCASMCMLSEQCMSIFNGGDGGKCYGCSTAYSGTTSGEVLQEIPGNVHYQIYPACEVGWVGYLRSCYKLSSHTWFVNGATECESDGAHAVHIESSIENEFLKEWIKTDSTTWGWYIGITDCEVRDEWRYYGNNQLVQFTDFKFSNSDESCCALFFDQYEYQWARFHCKNPKGYYFPTICENNVL